jgi:hypothetical protein
MGKSSLMHRTARKLRERGAAVAVVDLHSLGTNVSSQDWYRGLLAAVGGRTDGFALERELTAFWDGHPEVGPMGRWFAAIERVVLPVRPGPVVIFIDEIGATRFLPFSADEFFAAVRACYNRRSQHPELRRLTFCLLGAVTPSELIKDPTLTTFNIGRHIELTDFSDVEAAGLAAGLGRPLLLAGKLMLRVLHWTGGHPYLTQVLCQAVANDAGISTPAGVDRACRDLFLSRSALDRDKNLLTVKNRLLTDSEKERTGLLDLYARIRKHERLRDDRTNPLIERLKLTGITRLADGYLVVRNRIYHRVFDAAWVRDNQTDAIRQLEDRATRRGRLQAAAIVGVVLLVLGGLGLYAWTQARQARQSLQKAEDNLEVSLGAVEETLRNAGELKENSGSSTAVVASLLAQTEKHLERLKDLTDAPRARTLRAATEALAAELYLDQGLASKAEPAARASVALAEQLASAKAADGEAQQLRWRAHLVLGRALATMGHSAAAVESLRRSADVAGEQVARAADNAGWREDQARSLGLLGQVLWVQGYYSDGDAAHERAFRIRKELADRADTASAPDRLQRSRNLALAYRSRGEALDRRGTPAALKESEQAYRRDLELFRELVRARPASADYQMNLTEAAVTVATLEHRAGHAEQAKELIGEAVRTADALVLLDPDNAERIRLQIYARLQQSDLLPPGRDKAEAVRGQLDALRRFQQTCAECVEKDPRNAQWQSRLVTTQFQLALNLTNQPGAAEQREVKALLGKALEGQKRLAELDPESLRWVQQLKTCHAMLAHLANLAGDSRKAVAELRAGQEAVLHFYERRARAGSLPDDQRRVFVTELMSLANSLFVAGDYAGSRKVYEQALAQAEAGGAGAYWKRQRATLHDWVGRCLMQTAPKEVDPWLEQSRKALALREELAGAAPDDEALQQELVESLQAVAVGLKQKDQYREAAALLEQARETRLRLATARVHRLAGGGDGLKSVGGVAVQGQYGPEERKRSKQLIALAEQRFQLNANADNAVGLVEFYLDDARLEDGDTAAGKAARRARLQQVLDVYDRLAKATGKPLAKAEDGLVQAATQAREKLKEAAP